MSYQSSQQFGILNYPLNFVWFDHLESILHVVDYSWKPIFSMCHSRKNVARQLDYFPRRVTFSRKKRGRNVFENLAGSIDTDSPRGRKKKWKGKKLWQIFFWSGDSRFICIDPSNVETPSGTKKKTGISGRHGFANAWETPMTPVCCSCRLVRKVETTVG